MPMRRAAAGPQKRITAVAGGGAETEWPGPSASDSQGLHCSGHGFWGTEEATDSSGASAASVAV
jgi:hypothetical protein